MADENIKQVMLDAITDADSLERFINGSEDETVLTRLSAEYPTLRKAIKTLFENGGLPATPFSTKALMNASTLGNGQYAIVTNDTNTDNNGLYLKSAGEFKKVTWDVDERQKTYTDVAANAALVDAKTYTDTKAGEALTKAQINRGTLDGVGLRTITQVGTYFITNAPDFPTDYGKSEGFLRVTKFDTRFERELIDQYDYSNRYVQMGAGAWEKVGIKPKSITNEHLDELKTFGNYRTVAENAKQENGYPITGHDCFISVEMAGAYGTIQTVKNVAGDIATRAFRNRWTEWEVSIKTSEVQINRGTLDGVELRTITKVGTYYVKNATDFPPDFGNTDGFLRVTQFNTRFERELIAQFDYSNRYVQVGNVGEWQKVGIKSSEVQINRGTLDGVELSTITQVGTYFVTNATDFPPEFGRTAGFFSVTKFGLRFKRELIDQYDYSNRYVQMGAGAWEKISSSGSQDPGGSVTLDIGTLPKGEVNTNLLSEDEIFYNSFGSVSARQKSYGDMYELSNAQVANGDMLATVYGFFDQLVVDFPDYVSMQVLGEERTGLEIREYVILPRKINKMASSPASINTFPELLLFAGQHGQEYTAIVNLMIFCDEMMRNYNSRDIYGTLRTSAVLRIVPAMNPWGVKNADRRNSNNVDLNRNFPDGWENALGDKGDSPLSEIESVTLSNWVESNKTNAICTLNLHDHSDRALTWGSATAGWPEKLLFRSFQRVGKWYYSNFEDTTLEDPVSWLGNPRDGYADKYIFETLGVPALLFECPYINHPKLGPKISSVRFASRQILTEIMEMIMGRYFRELD